MARSLNEITSEEDMKEALENLTQQIVLPADELRSEINSLISKSFGRRFKADYEYFHPQGILKDVKLRRSNYGHLNIIGKRKFIFPDVVAGRVGWLFTPKELPEKFYGSDGSLIVVRPQYTESAEKYIALYKKRFGKSAGFFESPIIPDSF